MLIRLGVLVSVFVVLSISYAKTPPQELNLKPLEYVQAIGSEPARETTPALRAADQLVLTIPQQDILRWKAVVMDPFSILKAATEKEISSVKHNPNTHNPVLVDADASPVKPVPRDLIRLSLFPNASFLVEIERFYSAPYAFNWHGRIIEGGSGTVHIAIVSPYDICQVHIASNVGIFNITPTESPPFHVLIEANRWSR